jgi:hypothetical protein
LDDRRSEALRSKAWRWHVSSSPPPSPRPPHRPPLVLATRGPTPAGAATSLPARSPRRRWKRTRARCRRTPTRSRFSAPPPGGIPGSAYGARPSTPAAAKLSRARAPAILGRGAPDCGGGGAALTEWRWVCRCGPARRARATPGVAPRRRGIRRSPWRPSPSRKIFATQSPVLDTRIRGVVGRIKMRFYYSRSPNLADDGI